MPEPKRYKVGTTSGWKVNFRRKGKRYQARFSDAKYADAHREAIAYIASICWGDTPHKSIPLRELCDNYLRWCEKTRAKAYSTVKSDRQRLMTICDWCDREGVASAAEMSPSRFRLWMDYFFENHPLYRTRRKGREIAPPQNTWEKYRLAWSALANWAIDRGHLEVNVAAKKEFRRKIQERIPDRVLSPTEVEAVLDSLDGRGDIFVSVFFRLLLFTGMREAEAMRLRWEDVKFDRDQILIRRRTKSGRDRALHIHPELREWLLDPNLPRDTKLVLDNGAGLPKYKQSWWYKLLRWALDESGLARARVHDLRHTFVTGLFEAGAELDAAQAAAGHSSPEITMRYAHVAAERQRRVIVDLPYHGKKRPKKLAQN